MPPFGRKIVLKIFSCLRKASVIVTKTKPAPEPPKVQNSDDKPEEEKTETKSHNEEGTNIEDHNDEGSKTEEPSGSE